MARKENFDKIFSKFTLRNEDLVNEYEDEIGESLNDVKYDIKLKCEEINNIVKSPTYQLLYDATRNAINTGMDIISVLDNIKSSSAINPDTNSSIQKYFSDINTIYEKNGNKYNIEYCSENRDKLIEMNLKTVVSIAKRYQGIGVPLEDLISAGNVGLVVAYDKYDPDRAKLKDNILASLADLPEEATTEEILDAARDYLVYGDVKQDFNAHFLPRHIYPMSKVRHWVGHNIKNASFNSVAFWWIEAYIKQELNDNSRLVKKPKSEIQKDRERDGFYAKEKVISVDAPVKHDSDTPIIEVLDVADDDHNELTIIEAKKTFKENLNLLLDGVKSRDRSILLKKFGIGLPRPMEPKEIAEQEGLSIARVSQIFQTVIAQMQDNAQKYNIDENTLYESLQHLV